MRERRPTEKKRKGTEIIVGSTLFTARENGKAKERNELLCQATSCFFFVNFLASSLSLTIIK